MQVVIGVGSDIISNVGYLLCKLTWDIRISQTQAGRHQIGLDSDSVFIFITDTHTFTVVIMTLTPSLKPIGTEFWHTFPPNLNCTETRQRRIKYIVTDHTLAMNPDTIRLELMEELKAIESEYIDT